MTVHRLLIPTVLSLSLLGACHPSHGQPLGKVVRLSVHFAHIDHMLVSADTSRLSPEQRRARQARIADLRAYAAAGVFPHNHSRSEQTPLFVDEHGTRCAMAHLIESAGDGDLMNAVVATNNDGYVRELVDDHRVVAWLDRNGMTAYEAALIQPAYPCGWYEDDDCSENVSREYAAGTVLASVLGGASIATNISTRNATTGRGVFGLAAGGLGIALGYPKIDDDSASSTVRLMGVLNLGVGTVAAVLGLRSLLGARKASSRPGASPSGPPGWTVRPVLSPVGAGIRAGRKF